MLVYITPKPLWLTREHVAYYFHRVVAHNIEFLGWFETTAG